MFEIKQNASVRVPVRFLDSLGSPVTGVVFGNVTAAVWRSDGTSSTISVGVGDWTELSVGTFNGTGTYSLLLPSSATTVTGPFMYSVATAGAVTFIGSVKIVANEEVDTFTNVTTIAAQVIRVLGLLHENSVLDQTVFDVSNNLTSSRLRIYDTKAHAQAAGALGLLSTYTITATYVGENVQTYTVVLE